jgi:hypothetical protein
MKDPLLNCFFPLLFIIGTNFLLIPVMNHIEIAFYYTAPHWKTLLVVYIIPVIMRSSVFKATQHKSHPEITDFSIKDKCDNSPFTYLR